VAGSGTGCYVKQNGALGNTTAQHASNDVAPLFEVKVHQTKSSLEDSAGLAAWVGVVHYISTLGR
jgi:hypothetical protein